MRFFSFFASAASTLLVVTKAQTLEFSTPSSGTVWLAGQQETLAWTGDCSIMGSFSHSVLVQLTESTSGFVASIGNLDCSGNTTSVLISIPKAINTGSTYAIRVLTLPRLSYTFTFQIVNPIMTPVPSAATTPSTSSSTAGTRINGDDSLSMVFLNCSKQRSMFLSVVAAVTVYFVL